MMMVMTISANAMSYTAAKNEALFLSDKMAYELNLTDAQYDAVYEINLDYLMNVNLSADLYGIYWQRRNSDLMFVLSPYQYQIYQTANYFYRPLNWIRGAWRLAIYGRYSDRHLFYFARPRAWVSFRGGRNMGTRSYYQGRNFYAPTHGRRPGGSHHPNMNPRMGQHPGQGYNNDYRRGHYNGQPNNDYRRGQGNTGVTPQPQRQLQPGTVQPNRPNSNQNTPQQGQRVFRR